MLIFILWNFAYENTEMKVRNLENAWCDPLLINNNMKTYFNNTFKD